MRTSEIRRLAALNYRQDGITGMLGATMRGGRAEVAGRWKRLNRPVQERRIDRRYGISSRGIDLTHQNPDAGVSGYQATTASAFDRALSELDVAPSSCTFVDLGCGKGATLVLAARAGFRRVIGVELVPELLRTAEENKVSLARRFPDLARRIELVLGDAAAYELPPGPLLVYLFNPFGPETLAAVADRIEAAIVEEPRSVYVAYLSPLHAEVISERPAFETLRLTSDRSDLATFRTVVRD